ncbi:MAG: anti-sigma factor [Sphingomonadaceae bacterium]|nr:anti-sigma factor [Sphingomonadaceae bacterium]
MNACPDRILLLHGLIDGELDAINSVAIEDHVKICAGCAEALRRLVAMRAELSAAGVRHHAPEALRGRIEHTLAEAGARAAPPMARQRGGTFNGRWLTGGVFTGIAASLAFLIAMPQLTTTGVQDQLVASHVRSLLASHLTDVATSDRHVVKPWFNGRIDFAPPVVELADQGFPLAGGRLDYIEGRVVAALVYHRRLHTINLFVRPAGAFSSPVGVATRRDSYNLVRWTRDGLEFWAVSDIDRRELQQFRNLFESRSAS